MQWLWHKPHPTSQMTLQLLINWRAHFFIKNIHHVWWLTTFSITTIWQQCQDPSGTTVYIATTVDRNPSRTMQGYWSYISTPHQFLTPASQPTTQEFFCSQMLYVKTHLYMHPHHFPHDVNYTAAPTAYPPGQYSTPTSLPTNSTAGTCIHTICVSEYIRPVTPWPLPHAMKQQDLYMRNQQYLFCY